MSCPHIIGNPMVIPHEPVLRLSSQVLTKFYLWNACDEQRYESSVMFLRFLKRILESINILGHKTCLFLLTWDMKIIFICFYISISKIDYLSVLPIIACDICSADFSISKITFSCLILWIFGVCICQYWYFTTNFGIGRPNTYNACLDHKT